MKHTAIALLALSLLLFSAPVSAEEEKGILDQGIEAYETASKIKDWFGFVQGENEEMAEVYGISPTTYEELTAFVYDDHQMINLAFPLNRLAFLALLGIMLGIWALMPKTSGWMIGGFVLGRAGSWVMEILFILNYMPKLGFFIAFGAGVFLIIYRNIAFAQGLWETYQETHHPKSVWRYFTASAELPDIITDVPEMAVATADGPSLTAPPPSTELEKCPGCDKPTLGIRFCTAGCGYDRQAHPEAAAPNKEAPKETKPTRKGPSAMRRL